ncbi:MAG: cysteine synthase family protein [Erysipelotrichaceae bacterium]|nr:cysteine synthase family protein [Erysipelotrichaceae bacterium]MCI9311731.1 cysteine synthase family protein [Erysipelotrichaceae bacterium]
MKQVTDLIGHTDVIQLADSHIYVKLEKQNPGGSCKDRVVYAILADAWAKGSVHSGSHLIEASSGNTGIALAMLGNAFGVRVTIVMSEDMSEERKQLIRAYGANLELTPKQAGMSGAIAHMERLMRQDPTYVNLGQFDHPLNPLTHERTTGAELLRQVNGIDCFVCCAGTGGTFSGVSRALKKANPQIRCVLGEPLHHALVSGYAQGTHRIQGIGPNFIPKNLDTSLIDDILLVSDEEAFTQMRQFACETGILVGISSGANLALAKRLARYYPDQTIVTIAPDGGERYLSLGDAYETVSTALL